MVVLVQQLLVFERVFFFFPFFLSLSYSFLFLSFSLSLFLFFCFSISEILSSQPNISIGKPTVIVSFFGDQPFWGTCIRDQKLGYGEVPCKEATAEVLEEAIRFSLREVFLFFLLLGNYLILNLIINFVFH